MIDKKAEAVSIVQWIFKIAIAEEIKKAEAEIGEVGFKKGK
jgi:hypothetical protein